MKKYVIALVPVLCAGTLAAAAFRGERRKSQPDPLHPSSAAKLAPNLRTPSRWTSRGSYILQFRNTAAGLKAVRLAGARATRTYSALPMAAVTADPQQLRRLLAHPAVTRVSGDAGVSRSTDAAIPAIGGDLARKSGITGGGVSIAVLDSGIAQHADLGKNHKQWNRSRIVAGYDFVRNTPRLANNDRCGHGTLVAGIAAGNARASTIKKGGHWTTRQFFGVAPESNIINLRILDSHGKGTASGAIAAINWCIENRARYNIRVVNMSLGHPPYESYTTDPLCQAVEAAWKKGMVVVCAAGNRGRANPESASSEIAYGTINSPGNDPYVITVGAAKDETTPSTQDDWVATYSSRGPTRIDHVVKPDLIAPGNRIVSLRSAGCELERVAQRTNLVPRSYYWNKAGSGNSLQYFHLSGTSMAAAFVSGTAALMLQQDPTLTPDTIKARLMLTAVKDWRKDGLSANVFSRGAGYLNVPSALQAKVVANQPALSPWLQTTSSGIVIHTDRDVAGQTSLWADKKIWQSAALYTDYPGKPGTPADALYEAPRKWTPGGGAWLDQHLYAAIPTGLIPPDGDLAKTLWADQALWADAANTPDEANTIWANQALWADDPASEGESCNCTAGACAHENSTPPPDDPYGNSPGNYPGNGPGNYPSNGPGNYPSNGPGNYPTNGPGNYPSNGPGNYPSNNPGNTPPNGPPYTEGDNAQALWADVFKLCVLGED